MVVQEVFEMQTQNLGWTCFIYISVDFTSHDLSTVHATIIDEELAFLA